MISTRLRTLSLGLWLLCLVPFLPGLPWSLRLALVILLLGLYGRQLFAMYVFVFGFIGLGLTHDPWIFKTMSYALLRQCLYCETIIHHPNRPSIYAANYPSSPLSYLAFGLFPLDTCVLVTFPHGSYAVHWVVPKDQIIEVQEGKHNFPIILKAVSTKLQAGYSIFAYVDRWKKRKSVWDVNELRRGMFSIAQQLQVPIIPIVIEPITISSLGLIQQSRFRIVPGQPHLVRNVAEAMRKTRIFFNHTLEQLRTSSQTNSNE